MTVPTKLHGEASEQQVRKLHHFGFVVASISAVAEEFATSVFGIWDGKVTFDPVQRSNVAFVTTAGLTSPLIELIEPAAGDSPVAKFLQRGGGLHHVCFELADLDHELLSARSRGSIILGPPMPAAAFSGRRIAWVYTRTKLLIEYLEQ